MAAEWYYRDGERAIGPFSAAQIKAQVANARIKPETLLRKGDRGQWITAARVRGLFADLRPPQSGASAIEPSELLPGHTATEVDEEGEFLAPPRNRHIRLGLFALLFAFALIGAAAWYQKVFFILSMALMLGSYPIVQVKKETIEQTIVIGFFPVRRKSWRLRDFVSIQTDTEARITQSVGCLVLIIWPFWLMFRTFDYLMPWLGGDHKLWLRRYDEERLLIWQGNHASHFEANLRLLESRGLPIK